MQIWRKGKRNCSREPTPRTALKASMTHFPLPVFPYLAVLGYPRFQLLEEYNHFFSLLNYCHERRSLTRLWVHFLKCAISHLLSGHMSWIPGILRGSRQPCTSPSFLTPASLPHHPPPHPLLVSDFLRLPLLWDQCMCKTSEHWSHSS